MISTLMTYIETTLLPWGAFGVFAASIIEELIAIIPSSLVQLGSGFVLLGREVWSNTLAIKLITMIALPAALGVTIGSIPIYLLIRWGGSAALARWGKWFGISERDVNAIHDRVTRGWKDELIIGVGRALPIMPTVAITAWAAIFRIPFFTYLWATALGTFARALILGAVGWYAGAAYHEFAAIIDRGENLIWLALGLAAIGFVIWREKTRRR